MEVLIIINLLVSSVVDTSVLSGVDFAVDWTTKLSFKIKGENSVLTM
jgi:hypothetical protein